MEIVIFIGLCAAGWIAAFLWGLVTNKRKLTDAFESAQQDSKRVLEEARNEADRLVKQALREAKEEQRTRRHAFEEEAKQRRAETLKLENKIKSREKTLEKKLEILEKRENELENLAEKLRFEEKQYKSKIRECEENIEKSRATLENIANMSQEEAKRELIKSLEEVAKKEAQESIRQIEEDAQREAEQRSRSVISLAVQRISSEYVNDSSISVVALPTEEMKGRIIGREGRNIRAIEQSTGVDLIIDDTPEAVIISCFNPIRREVAKTTLERLIADGRIHPARIEETVKRVESEFDQILQDHGEQASLDSGITDLHPELIKLLGKLRYRATNQQSVLRHCTETAHICGVIASEFALNVKQAKRCGLLHDIGKAVDQEVEGSHAQIGAELCLKYGESPEVAEAIRLHHAENLSRASLLAVVLHAANRLSANRPGARKEVLESYVKRLTDMESIVTSFKGVEQAYVLQAGREVRAMVTPNVVSDDAATDLSYDIASKLRQELTFPGQVRVTVVRESKASEFAT